MFLVKNLCAQDERLFRNTVLGAFYPTDITAKLKDKYLLRTNSSMYRVDITGNGFKEGIIIEKMGAESWLHIHNTVFSRLNSFSLEEKGLRARPYKLVLKHISPTVRALLVYFYEGYSEYLDFHGSSRLYIITITDGDIENAIMTAGPQFFEESREIHKRYYLKRMEIYTKDLDNNGVKEIILSKHLMTKVLVLRSDGKWR